MMARPYRFAQAETSRMFAMLKGWPPAMFTQGARLR